MLSGSTFSAPMSADMTWAGMDMDISNFQMPPTSVERQSSTESGIPKDYAANMLLLGPRHEVVAGRMPSLG